LVADEPASESAELLSSLDSIGDLKDGEDLLALADMFNEISALGEAERKTCLDILKTFAEYQRSSRRSRHGR